MSLDAVLASKTSFATACCRNISVSISSKSVLRGSSTLGFVTVSVDFRPSNNVSISLNVLSASNGKVCALTPAVLTFTSSGPLVIRSALSAVCTGETGLMRVSAGSFGPDSRSYSLQFTTGFVVNVIGADAEPSSPALISATLSSDGTSFNGLFDSPTNKAGYVNDFKCSELVWFQGVEIASSCLWSSSTLFTAYLGPSATLGIGDRISLRPKKLKAFCSSGVDCSGWKFSPSVNVTLRSPLVLLVPVVSVTGPNLLGSCSPLTIDVSSSVGSAGRAWTNVSFAVSGITTSSSISAEAVLESATKTQQFLNEVYTVSPPTAIPAALLTVGSFNFVVTLCNFLGGCGQGTLVVNVVDLSVPLVRIFGSPTRTTLARSPFTLTSEAVKTSCGGTTASSAGFIYSWSVVKDGTPMPSLVSRSRQASIFLLAPNVLAVGSYYSITLSVFDTVASTVGTASVEVYVQPSDIVAVISGGALRGVSTATPITLSAESSYDQDKIGVSGSNAGLSFSWSCSTIAPVLLDSCLLRLSGTSSGAIVVSVPERTLSNTSVQITVSVTDRTRIAQASVTVFVQMPSLPLVSLIASTSLASKVNPSSTVSLQGSVSMIGPSYCFWTSSDSTIDLSQDALTPYVALFNVSRPSSSLFSMLLSPNVLLPRHQYSFILSCGAGLMLSVGDVSSGQISFVTNGPPLPGKFGVSPDSGSALSDLFQFSASQWVDEDLPITYSFGFFSTSGDFQSLQSQSQLSFVLSTLPAGLAANENRLTCGVRLFDVLGSNSSSESDVVVFPFSGNSADVADIVSSSLSSGLTTDQSLQILSTAGATLNFVTCSLAPNCTKLNRKDCLSTANTCGECKSAQYVGDAGDSNSRCLYVGSSSRRLAELSQSVSLGQDCDFDIDCSGWLGCISGICSPVPKTCVAQCSSRGVCGFTNSFSGDGVVSCFIGDPTCSATCTCNAGYSGSSCEFVDSELASKLAVRELLIEVLANLTVFSDADSSSVTSWLASLVSLSSQPSELSSRSLQLLFAVSSTIAQDGRTLGLNTLSLEPLLSAVDNGCAQIARKQLSGDNSTATEASSQLKVALSTFGDFVFSTMVSGQKEFSRVLSQLKVIFDIISVDSQQPESSIQMFTPQTSLESQSAVIAPHILLSVDPKGISGDAKLMVVQLSKLMFGADLEGINSNTLLVKMDNSSICNQFSSCNMSYVIPNIEAESFIPRPAEFSRTFECESGLRKNISFACPSGINATAECDGIQSGRITVLCPYLESYPTCSVIKQGYNLEETNCQLVSYSNVTTSCSCHGSGSGTHSRRLDTTTTWFTNLTTTGVEFAATTKSVFVPSVFYMHSVPPTSTPTSTPTPPTHQVVDRIREILSETKFIILGCALSFFFIVVAVLIYYRIRYVGKKIQTKKELEDMGIDWKDVLIISNDGEGSAVLGDPELANQLASPVRSSDDSPTLYQFYRNANSSASVGPDQGADLNVSPAGSNPNPRDDHSQSASASSKVVTRQTSLEFVHSRNNTLRASLNLPERLLPSRVYGLFADSSRRTLRPPEIVYLERLEAEIREENNLLETQYQRNVEADTELFQVRSDVADTSSSLPPGIVPVSSHSGLAEIEASYREISAAIEANDSHSNRAGQSFTDTELPAPVGSPSLSHRSLSGLDRQSSDRSNLDLSYDRIYGNTSPPSPSAGVSRYMSRTSITNGGQGDYRRPSVGQSVQGGSRQASFSAGSEAGGGAVTESTRRPSVDESGSDFRRPSQSSVPKKKSPRGSKFTAQL